MQNVFMGTPLWECNTSTAKRQPTWYAFVLVSPYLRMHTAARPAEQGVADAPFGCLPASIRLLYQSLCRDVTHDAD